MSRCCYCHGHLGNNWITTHKKKLHISCKYELLRITAFENEPKSDAYYGGNQREWRKIMTSVNSKTKRYRRGVKNES
jgi:hypothetical protein